MRRAAICLLTLMSALPAVAADEQWGFVRSDRDVRLFYGLPESDVVTLNIICEPKRKRINFANFVLPPKPRQGATVTTKLINGAATLEYNGKVKRDRDLDVSYVEARVRFDAEFFKFLGAGSTLTVEAPGKRESIPLMGILEPLAMMEQACLGNR